jgi:hypothetical protein
MIGTDTKYVKPNLGLANRDFEQPRLDATKICGRNRRRNGG